MANYAQYLVPGTVWIGMFWWNAYCHNDLCSHDWSFFYEATSTIANLLGTMPQGCTLGNQSPWSDFSTKEDQTGATRLPCPSRKRREDLDLYLHEAAGQAPWKNSHASRTVATPRRSANASAGCDDRTAASTSEEELTVARVGRRGQLRPTVRLHFQPASKVSQQTKET
jgi:hypothetical protein